jgi:hypothetical protein
MKGVNAAKAAFIIALVLTASPTAHAEFRGKGSWVGRMLTESVAEADESPGRPRDIAADDEDDGAMGADDSVADTETQSARDVLNKLMKHPTEPVYDPLRPMSGRWVRCRANGAASQDTSASVPASASPAPYVLDRFSSSDRAHFTRTIVSAIDASCKNVISSERFSYECGSLDKRSLECKLTKREAKAGSANAPWTESKIAGSEKPVRVSFKGLETGKKKKKRSTATPKTRDPRKLEVVMDGETFALEFEPSAPKAAATPAAKPAN